MLQIVVANIRFDVRKKALSKLKEIPRDQLLGIGLGIEQVAIDGYFQSLGAMAIGSIPHITAARAAERYELDESSLTLVLPKHRIGLDEAMAVYLLLLKQELNPEYREQVLSYVAVDPRTIEECSQRMEEILAVVDASPQWCAGDPMMARFARDFVPETAQKLYSACTNPKLHYMAKIAMVREYIEMGTFTVPAFSDYAAMDDESDDDAVAEPVVAELR